MEVISKVGRERLDSMLEAVDVGLWYCDLPFDVLVWDRKVKEHFWLSPDAVVTIDDFYRILHPDDRERTRAAIALSIESHSPYDIEYRTCSPPDSPSAGMYKWIRALGYTSYDDAGMPIRFDGVTVDITRQKLQAEHIEASEQRFRIMADNAPVMIWVTREDGYCTYLNKQWLDFTGQTLEEATGFGWLEAVHPEDRKRAEDEFVSSNARKAAFSVDYRLRRHDGEYRWAIDAAHPWVSPSGVHLGYIGSVIDIHERKETEREREQLLAAERLARAEAEYANRAKSQFLAVMSHELRTPLNAILGYSDLLMTGVAGPLNSGQHQHLERVKISGRMLLDLIDDVLTFARLEAGKEDFTALPIDVHAAVQEALLTIRPDAQKKDVVVRAESDGQPLAIHNDPRKLRQVLINLLANAVKFTDDGEIVVRIKRGADSVQISVKDTGIGIPESARATIFEPFTQLDQSHTRRAGGAGLGLAISKRFAQMMRGDLTVESEAGKGSVFTLTLPLKA